MIERMKKMKYISICCLTVLAVLLSACAAFTEPGVTITVPEKDPVPDEMKSTVETAAQQVVSDLAGGNFAAVTAHFDATMATALSSDKLKDAWEAVEAEAGIFSEIMMVESFVQDGYYVCLVTTKHETTKNEIKGVISRIVYNKDMQIAGLFFSYTEMTDESQSELAENETAVTVGTEYPLDGVLAIPSGTEKASDGTKKVPAVVLVHGSGPSDKDESAYGIKFFKDVSDYLSTNGVAVLRYDKRTYVHASKMSPDITVKEETIDDAILAAQLLSKDERIDDTKIFMLGHSMGGMLAPRIVEESKGLFAGAIIMAGSPRSLLDIIYDQNMYFIALADEAERDALTKQVEESKPYFGLPKGYIEEMDAHPASDYINSTDKPYLIMQGGKDFQVSVEKDFESYKKLVGEKSNFEFQLYDNLTHFFTTSTMEFPTTDDYASGTHASDAPLKDIVKWIKER